jgi:transketolase|tara:strand:+ start:111 stop:932 length:822 start_codon:yes stop_codon:yes gene_type:complete
MKSTQYLQKISKKLRNTVLDLCFQKGGHISSSFSCTEILVCLYYSGFLNINPKNLKKKSRDIFVLSKGHGAEMLYAVLSDLKFFPQIWLKNSYRDGECKLGGHVNHDVPGIELSTGSLGHGLNFVAGTALADKLDKKKNNKHVVLLGDAECSAGSVWEAASFIAFNKISSVIAIVDLNFIGNFDFIKNFMDWKKLYKLWKACGWHVIKINDGNNINQVINALEKTKKIKNKPIAIIAHTVKGKGVKKFEGNRLWATRQVDKITYREAKKEINR